jgi:hypothetical protein
MSGMDRTRRRVDRASSGALVGALSEARVSGLSLVPALSFTIPFPWMEADSGAVREG